ncbi:MAG: tRNA (N6-isopentenyl adenosine(37)-C2)-methylthiotransferase MiaB [Alphaproteobacteria bacterium]|nr:tRNA (N6-isopentenyl adenosine(37)-C2)-methylthiotransferase MiaB [Alphaproteobacteria bacterium]
MTKSAYIKTYGCQMNVYDSARMGEALALGGYAAAQAPEEADLIILNTCHIREKAAEKVYSEIGRLKKLKEKNKNIILAVAGCVAQAEGEEMLNRAPILDLVFGPQNFQTLPNMLDELQTRRRQHIKGGIVQTAFPAAEKFNALKSMPRKPLSRQPTAFITIQEGCDKFCSFCVVPYTRGAEISRPADDIEREARALIAKGVCEITLLGQNVNAWYDARAAFGLAGLLKRLAKIDGLARLRFTTSHPRDMNDELIAAYGELPKLMPYLHLPVQSGSDRILQAMNRQYTSADYLRLIEQIRLVRPDIALSSDFIVGFPGESEEDFAATLDLLREVEYAQAYSFKYSPRPGTPAAEKEQIDDAIKTERLYRLQALLTKQQTAFNQAQKGKTLPVLFEKLGKKQGQMTGRSPYLQPVHVMIAESIRNSRDLCGQILPVHIEKCHANSLSGALVG